MEKNPNFYFPFKIICKDFKENSDYYETDCLEKIDYKLKTEHYLFISGDPGSGKTISASHLAVKYYFSEPSYEFQWISDRKLNDAIQLIQTNQINPFGKVERVVFFHQFSDDYQVQTIGRSIDEHQKIAQSGIGGRN